MKATRETNGNKSLPRRFHPCVVHRVVARVELPCGCSPFPVGLPCVPAYVCFGCCFRGLVINSLTSHHYETVQQDYRTAMQVL